MESSIEWNRRSDNAWNQSWYWLNEVIVYMRSIDRPIGRIESIRMIELIGMDEFEGMEINPMKRMESSIR